VFADSLLGTVKVNAKNCRVIMRTLLRSIPTGLYFQGADQWTSNAAEARDFKSIDRALKFIEEWNLKGMELAFAFRDADHVTGVPLERIALRYSEPES
jgi:hypothetical protein